MSISFLNKSGTNTSDATATVDDILYPKTAYVDNKKIVGNIETKKEEIISQYYKKILGSTQATLYDIYVYDNLILLMYYYNNTLTFKLLKDLDIIASEDYIISNYFTYGTVDSLAINLNVIDENFIEFTIVLSYKSSGNYYSEFKKLKYTYASKEFELYGNILKNQTGNSAGTKAVIIRDETIYNKFYFITRDGNDDQFFSYTIDWDNNSATLKWYLSHSGYYNVEVFKNSGSDWITQKERLTYINKSSNTATTYAVSAPVFFSTKMNYMCYNGALYNIPNSTNWNTINNGKTKIMDLSYENIQFSKDDNYLFVVKSPYLYIYALDETSVTLVYTHNYEEFCALVPTFNSDYPIVYDGSKYKVDLYYYTDKDTIIKKIIHKGLEYSYIDDVNVPNTNKVLSSTNYIGINATIMTGTMPNNGELNFSPSTEIQSIPEGYTSGGTISAVTATIDSNIIAENIREGITILGVTGTYTGETTTTETN